MMDRFNRQWITANAIEVCARYREGELTLRALHYQLVGRGMTNTIQHYKRVVKAMEVARWEGLISFETFSDLDRTVIGETKAEATNLQDLIEEGKDNIAFWMRYYKRNRWENQPYYAEVWIEKKALQNVFAPVCEELDIALAPCKGYPSLTFLNEAAQRFTDNDTKKTVILYFGDYDPSGEDIPRSIEENINRITGGSPYVQVRRFALFEEQVRKWNLPHAPAKTTDSRTASWNGLGQVELDAVEVSALRKLAREAIATVFDPDLYDDLKYQEEQEAVDYRQALKEYVQTL